MGMTAIDAATQAKRLGASEVTMVYRRTEAEKPCTDAELDIAKLDGCKIIWLAAPKEIIGTDGKVTQLVCSVMKLGVPDTSGRRSPVDTGETFVLDADMIIKAAGQMPFEKLAADNHLDNQNGKLLVTDKAITNIPGVFAGGDCVNGGKEVVDAVQAGKDGAIAILNYIF
jgi:glutamate synthase (NADPH/NADH) small chain